MATIKPLGNRVLLRPIDTPDTYGSGLLARPDVAKEKPVEAIVIAVGPGYHAELTGSLVPMSVKPGDRVSYGIYSGSDIRHEGVGMLIMREDEILAVVEKNEEEKALERFSSSPISQPENPMHKQVEVAGAPLPEDFRLDGEVGNRIILGK